MFIMSKPTNEDLGDIEGPIITSPKSVEEPPQKNRNYSSIEDHLRHLTNYYEAKLGSNISLSIRDYSTHLRDQFARLRFVRPNFLPKLCRSFCLIAWVGS